MALALRLRPFLFFLPGNYRWVGGGYTVCLDRPSTADGPDDRLMIFFWGGAVG